MKRYLLFAGSWYYPGGGWNDFVESFDTLEEAMEHPDAIQEEYTNWYMIVDSTDGQIVKGEGP